MTNILPIILFSSLITYLLHLMTILSKLVVSMMKLLISELLVSVFWLDSNNDNKHICRQYIQILLLMPCHYVIGTVYKLMHSDCVDHHQPAIKKVCMYRGSPVYTIPEFISPGNLYSLAFVGT